MGWLGYFVGKNNHLKDLSMCFTPASSASVTEVLEPFLMGINNNKSINYLDISDMDLLGGRVFTMMGPFLKNNDNLRSLAINGYNLGNEGTRLLALALGSFSSLTDLALLNNHLPDDGLIDIITSLSMHPNLRGLDLDGNRLQTNGCKALSTLLNNSANELKTLDLANNELDDERIHALIHGLKNCDSLQTLSLCNNPSITSKGCQHLATILESPDSNITDLNLANNNVDDEAAAVITRSILNNTLHTLNLNNNNQVAITEKGWEAVSKNICDTTSVNSTFRSNHTLQTTNGHVFGDGGNVSLQPLFMLNTRSNKKEVAMIKILQHHNDINMTPFFEWEFKVLPLMIDWFARASSITMPGNFEFNIGPRKLSTIYQFVREMPLLYVETVLRKE